MPAVQAGVFFRVKMRDFLMKRRMSLVGQGASVLHPLVGRNADHRFSLRAFGRQVSEGNSPGMTVSFGVAVILRRVLQQQGKILLL